MCYDYRTQKEQILKWLRKGIENGATHCFIVSDCWDSDDFPVYVLPDQDVRKVAEAYTSKNRYSERLMEVYKLDMDLDVQLQESRAMNY